MFSTHMDSNLKYTQQSHKFSNLTLIPFLLISEGVWKTKN